MLVVSDREAIGRCVAEYEALRSGAESSLVHRRPIDDGEPGARAPMMSWKARAGPGPAAGSRVRLIRTDVFAREIARRICAVVIHRAMGICEVITEISVGSRVE